MTDATTETTETTEPAVPGWVEGPPGVLFYAGVVVAIVLAIAFAITTDFIATVALLVGGGLLWLAIAAVWLARFIDAVGASRGQMSVRRWTRWLAIPLLMGLVFAGVLTDAFPQARFLLSRGALDSMARDIEGGGSLERGWVGLYEVGRTDRTGSGFMSVVDDQGMWRWGLVYSPGGDPQLEQDSLWTGATLVHLDGPWWTFEQGWD